MSAPLHRDSTGKSAALCRTLAVPPASSYPAEELRLSVMDFSRIPLVRVNRSCDCVHRAVRSVFVAALRTQVIC